MDISTTAPMVAKTIDRITIMDDAKAVMAFLARRTPLMREEFGDIMRLILKTAPHDKAASETLATATIRYRQGAFVLIVFWCAEVGKVLGDKQSLVAFGYAGWASGQLEGELAQGV